MTGSACVAMRRALLTCFLRDAITLFLCLVLSVDQSVSISPIRKTHESLKTGNRQSESRHRWENLIRVLPPPACHATVFTNSLFCHPEPFPAPSSRFGPLKPNSCTQSPARPVPFTSPQFRAEACTLSQGRDSAHPRHCSRPMEKLSWILNDEECSIRKARAWV